MLSLAPVGRVLLAQWFIGGQTMELARKFYIQVHV